MIFSILYALQFIYLELLNRIVNFHSVDTSFASCVLYCLFLGFAFGIINMFLPIKVKKIIFMIMSFVFTFFYGSSIICYKVFNIVMTPDSLSLAKNFTGDFLSNTFAVIKDNLWLIALVLVPFIIYALLIRTIRNNKPGKYEKAYSTVLTLLFISLFILTSLVSDGKVHEQYYLKNNYANSSRTIGVLPTLVISTRKNLTGFEEEVIIVETVEEPEVEEVVYTKRKNDIPFSTIEGDSNITQMNNFFKNEEVTYTNEYTGLFKDKNLIYIMAESFDGYMVNKELTPTLYKMIHNGFDFKNYYSPTNLSTIGGEFSLLTGLVPDLTCLNRQWIRVSPKYDNYYPYALADLFKNMNYKTYAYHDHEYDFQSRDKYLASIGFDNYLGCWNGLEKRMGCRIFPKSDDEMIKATYTDYINDEHFMVYYATVSGHGGWQFGDNDMADKNREYVEDLPYSRLVIGYIGGNLELEFAMRSLLEVLEENGRLEDTVIIMAADHHPYFLSDEQVEELAGKELDQFELYHNNLIIYNCELEHTVIDKPCNTIDVFPTMLNLFDIDYDSRLIIGKDIFADNGGLVIYSDYSWLTEKGTYSAKTGRFTPKQEFENMDRYVDYINSKVEGRYLMSEYIMKYDYYRLLKDYLN